MKKFVFFVFSCLLVCNLFAKEGSFDGGTYFINEENGKLDLEHVTVKYDSGDVFFGKADNYGSPIFGTLKYSSGATYKGYFSDDYENGFGVFESSSEHYEGNWKDGERCGNGIWFNKFTGDSYEGNWEKNRKNGYGVLKYNKGTEVYQGNFVNDQKNGEGVWSSKDGASYEGNWKNDSIKGSGKLVDSVGNIFEGNFIAPYILDGSNNSYVGVDGTSYFGDFVDGKFDGVGTYTDKDGNVYHGSFKENQKTGAGRTKYADGSEYIGYYMGNERNLEGVYKFYNDIQYEGGFLAGTFNGKGYLGVETPEEIAVFGSTKWDGTEIPRETEVVFSNGDSYIGLLEDGLPVIGYGAWLTKEERLALYSKRNNAQLALYSYDNQVYDFDFSFNPDDMSKYIHSAKYISSFSEFYAKHEKTFRIALDGLKAVANVVSLIPTPIAPIARGISIAASVTHVVLKNMKTSNEVKQAILRGDTDLVRSLKKENRKDIAWDIVNVVLGGAGFAGTAIESYVASAEVAKGIKETAPIIAKIITYSCDSSSLLLNTLRLLKTLRTKKDIQMDTIFDNNEYIDYANKNGGVNFGTKKSFIRQKKQELFVGYSEEDANTIAEIIVLYGYNFVPVISRNGNQIIKAYNSLKKTDNKNLDNYMRLLVDDEKYKERIEKCVALNNEPAGVLKYIYSSKNYDEALLLLVRHPEVASIVEKYGNHSMELISKYEDKAVRAFSKYGDVVIQVLKNGKLKKNKYEVLIDYIDMYTETACSQIKQNNYMLPAYVSQDLLKESQSNQLLADTLRNGNNRYGYSAEKIYTENYKYGSSMSPEMKSYYENIIKIDSKTLENSIYNHEYAWDGKNQYYLSAS